MPTPLPSNATLNDLRSSPLEKVSFARKALGVMSKARSSHGVVVLRMGVTGTGQQPNYRLEDASGNPLLAIDGGNHKPWPEGANFGEPGNWSSVTMTYEDVAGVIASITGYKSGAPSKT